MAAVQPKQFARKGDLFRAEQPPVVFAIRTFP